jgi:hypothetical protein
MLSLKGLLRTAAALAALLTTAVAFAAEPPRPAAQSLGPVYVLRAYVGSRDDVRRLTSGPWDVLEARGPDYILVMGGDKTIGELRQAGFRVAIDHEVTIPAWFSPETYYGGYRTVAEHYAHLDTVQTNYPGLTMGYTYGQSWVVAHPGTWPAGYQPPGYPLRAICITNLQPGDCQLIPSQYPNPAKPRFFLMTAIHARELTTAEMAWRWIDYLTQNYNVDPDVTMLLDSYEMWVVPVVNPDGRWLVELGGGAPIYQRKNANNSLGACGPPPGSQYGVDLNRNSNSHWSSSGASSDPCSEVYYGRAVASEPETQGIQALIADLFPDLKGPNDSDPAPADTPGTMLTLHTYADLVIFPWGCQFCAGNPHSPNDAGLRTFGARMAYFLQGSTIPPPPGWYTYTTGQAYEILYEVSGTTDDFAYGTLGVPSFTWEMGPGPNGNCNDFLPAYNCQDGYSGFPGGFWGIARKGFVYAAKNTRTGYLSTSGPDAVVPNPNIFTVEQGTPFTFNAFIDDHTYGSDVPINPPTERNITAAEYYLDTPPWAGGTAVPMSATDGTFNQHTEGVTASIDTSALSLGRHTIYFRGQNTSTNWGAATAVWLNVGSAALADLSVAETVSPVGAVCPATTLTYTIQAANLGPSTGSGITLTVSLPAPATSISGSGWSCSGTTTVTCTMASLPLGSAPAITIIVAAPSAAGTAASSVAIAGTTSDTNTSNNTASVSNTILPTPPSPTASSNSPLCVGGTLALSCTAVAGATYQWTGPNGFSASGRTPSIPGVTTAASGTYSVTATVQGCVSAAGTTSVTINTNPDATITAPANVCANSTGNTASVAEAGATSYAWTITGGTITAGASSQTATYTAGASGNVVLSVTVIKNGCTASNSQTIGITANPNAVITAPSGVVADSTGNTASVPVTAGATYAWTIANGTITAGAGTDTITFTAGSSGTVDLSVTVTASGCGSTANQSVTINPVGTVLRFFTLTPCRLIDTRRPAGTYGGPALQGGAQRDFPIDGQCGIPADAVAVSANVTVAGPTGLGDLRIYPTGLPAPSASSINFNAGRTRANNVLMGLTSSPVGSMTVQCDIVGGTTHFLFDVGGYFRFVSN